MGQVVLVNGFVNSMYQELDGSFASQIVKVLARNNSYGFAFLRFFYAGQASQRNSIRPATSETKTTGKTNHNACLCSGRFGIISYVMRGVSMLFAAARLQVLRKIVVVLASYGRGGVKRHSHDIGCLREERAGYEYSEKTV